MPRCKETDHCGWMLSRHSENINMNKYFKAHRGSNTLCSLILTAYLHRFKPVSIDFILGQTFYKYMYVHQRVKASSNQI